MSWCLYGVLYRLGGVLFLSVLRTGAPGGAANRHRALRLPHRRGGDLPVRLKFFENMKAKAAKKERARLRGGKEGGGGCCVQ